MFACDSGSLSLRPPQHAGHQSALVVLEVEDRTRVIALETDDMERFVGPPFNIERKAQMTMLLYPQSLAELDLPPGEVELATVEPSRPLPQAAEMFESAVEDPGWSRLAERPERLDGIRIRATARDQCLAGGGCYADARHAEELWCDRPCPASVPVAPVVEPAPPMPAVLTWSPPERVPCSGSDVQWVDQTSCAPIASCPAGRFADEIPAGAVYVDPEAGPGGDGSLAAPFRTIAEASAPIMALSKGTHSATVSLAGARIIGACPAETMLVGSIQGSGHLRIERARVRGQLSMDGGMLELEAALVEGPSRALISANGAEIWGRDVVLRSLAGTAFELTSSSLDLQRAVIQAGERGIFAQQSDLMLHEVAISGATLSGITATGGIRLSRVLFDSNLHFGLEAFAAQLQIADVVVHGGGELAGAGMLLSSSTGIVERVLVERTSATGIHMGLAELHLRDILVRDLIRPDGDMAIAGGIIASQCTLTVERLHTQRTIGRGIEVGGGTFTGTDVTIEDVGAAPLGGREEGFGMAVGTAEVELSRVEVRNALTSGMFFEGPRVNLSDVRVEGSVDENGMVVRNVGNFFLSRAVFADNRDAGITIDGTSVAVLDSIRSTVTNSGAAFGGESVVDATNLHITETKSLGICLRDEAKLTARDLVIERVQAEESTACTITNPPPGTAIIMNGVPSLNLMRFLLSANRTGMLLNRDAVTTIMDGEIRDNFVGVQIDPQVSPAAVTIRVLFTNNVSDVEVY